MPDAPPAVFTPPTATPAANGAVFAAGFAPSTPPVTPDPPAAAPVAIGAVFSGTSATPGSFHSLRVSGELFAGLDPVVFPLLLPVSANLWTNTGIAITEAGLEYFISEDIEGWTIGVKLDGVAVAQWTGTEGIVIPPEECTIWIPTTEGISGTPVVSREHAIGVTANTPGTPPVPPAPSAASPQSSGSVFAPGFAPSTPPAAFAAPTANPSTPPIITP